MPSVLLDGKMPLVTGERSGFRKFCVRTILDVVVPCQRKLARNVSEIYAIVKKALIDELQKTVYGIMLTP